MHEKDKFAEFDVLAVVGRLSEHLVDLVLLQGDAAVHAGPVELDLVDSSFAVGVEQLEDVPQPFILLFL